MGGVGCVNFSHHVFVIFEIRLLTSSHKTIQAIKWAIPSFVLYFILFFKHVFTHAPSRAWVFRLTISPPPPSDFQLFVPTQPKKAQVLFLPSQEKLKFLFLLGTENAVGGVGPWQCMPSCFTLTSNINCSVFFTRRYGGLQPPTSSCRRLMKTKILTPKTPFFLYKG